MTTDTAIKAEPKRAEWQVLTSALSVGRRKDEPADMPIRGETIWLTEEESAGFLDPARHKTPVIRPASQRNDPMPRITAAGLFGAKGRPAPPAPVPGSAALDVTNESRIGHVDGGDPANHPEAQLIEVTDPDAGNEGATARSRGRRQ